MDNCNYLNKKIEQVGYLYKYDLLNDFLQDKYRDDDYLYNFYSSCVKKIESNKIPNCVYELLWESPKQNSDKCCDVMNSFNTYMNKIVGNKINNDQSYRDAYAIFKKIKGANRQRVSKQVVSYLIKNQEIKEKMKEELIDMIQLAKWTNTIGNFILLPQTERGKRGENVYKNNKANDRMDVYLDNLKKHFGSKKFSEYINQNYLWDYVDKKYNVTSLFLDSDNKRFEQELPNDPKCYIAFAKNIINNIKHRGMFMEIMIRLSIEVPKQFAQVKDTKNANSYAEVIGTIEPINLPENLKSLINNFQMEIV